MSDEEENLLDSDEEENVADIHVVADSKFHDDIYSSISRSGADKSENVPLWLITFTDVMALMLTFFVLLYSMSVPQEDKWDKVSDALSRKFQSIESKPYNAGSQDADPIDKISKTRALNLGYLKVIITNLLKEKADNDIILFQNGDRLVVSMPSESLFESGAAKINLQGKKILFSLGGVLSRVKNRIEIVGHTDPRPITNKTGLYKTNWELSLARSTAIASILEDVGYDRSITVRGLSSSRYDELSEDVPEQERYDLSRRVDIIIMDEAGLRSKFYNVR